ncbi:hypothetical protein ACIKTA_06685, partial [Hansschlegelia beijingensis]
MRLYRQILISACCVAPLALATGASAACLDEVEKLSAQVQSHQTPPKGPPATRTANDPEHGRQGTQAGRGSLRPTPDRSTAVQDERNSFG